MSLRPIAPRRRPLDGPRLRVPASKSIANRELVLSALADGVSHLDLGPLDPGDDVRAMREALGALGYEVRDEGDGRLRIVGGEARLPVGPAALEAHEGGTVARFGIALAAAGAHATVVDGSERMRERPIAPLLRALRELGAAVEGDRLPVTVRGPLAGGTVTVPGNESSQ
ncbi:MAG: 3-phosphoshikimate 1-carboxyvinyltransferase, partial [Candidatus Limnocylindria bacterium]|nr:3-phosphoshikimate 1-carboxyvinyltransferase [Candidatus Limnocylindria bacterium]